MTTDYTILSPAEFFTADVRKTLVKELERVMTEANVDVPLLAEVTNNSRRYIKRLLNRELTPDIDNISNLAFAMGYRIAVKIVPVKCYYNEVPVFKAAREAEIQKDLERYMAMQYVLEVMEFSLADGGGLILSLPEMNNMTIHCAGETYEEARAGLDEMKRSQFEEWIRDGVKIPLPKELARSDSNDH